MQTTAALNQSEDDFYSRVKMDVLISTYIDKRNSLASKEGISLKLLSSLIAVPTLIVYFDDQWSLGSQEMFSLKLGL